MLKQYFSSQTNKFQPIAAILVVLAVAAIGTVLLLISHAASPYASINADSGTLTSPATKQTCTGASDGNCVVFGSAGGSSGTIPACTPVPPPNAQTNQCDYTAYTTGYGWWDNTPPGSTAISNPVIHQVAGGTGTYADPITLAVGHSISGSTDTLEFPAGTIWYIPNLRRYFIVEDTCGDGNKPQDEACWDLSGDAADGSAPAGAQIWIDLYTDGSDVSQATSNNCEDAITANHLAIMNPASDYTVVSGSVDSSSGCSQQYGNTIVTD